MARLNNKLYRDSQNIVKKYVTPQDKTKEEVIEYLKYCTENKIVNREYDSIPTDLIVYYDLLYAEDNEIQNLIKALKKDVYNKVKWQKQLLTSLTHTDEQYNNFKVSLFGDEPITIYHSQLRQLLREVRDKEKML